MNNNFGNQEYSLTNLSKVEDELNGEERIQWEIVTAPTKRRSSLLNRGKVALVAVCVCLSFLASVIGSSIGSRLTADGDNSNWANGASYRSVVSTNLAGKANLSVAEIAEVAADSVVEITTEIVQTGSRFRQFVSEGAGSGVIISTDGYIVTNNHVIDGASRITVRLSDGKTANATLIGKDAQTDLAVIKISRTDLTPAVMGSSGNLKVGELAVAIGNPLGELGGTVTDGIISALDREITIDGEKMTLLQTNAAINPGNSGGGLFNSAGELIGVVNAKSGGSDIEGLGFAIPIDTAKMVIQQLMNNGYVSGRLSLGVTLVDISDTATARRYRVSQLGVYVYESTNQALKGGDLLQKIGDKAVESSADVKSALKGYSAGDTVSITIVRDGQVQIVKATLSEKK